MNELPPYKVLRKRARRLLSGSLSPKEHIHRLQLHSPPHYDPRNTLLVAVRKCLPPDVDAMFRFGVLWAGEVGDMVPTASVRPIPPGEEYAIVLNSGIKSLLYSVARGMAAATVVHAAPSGPTTETVDPEIAARVAEVFRTYATTPRLLTPKHPIGEEQKTIAHQIATSAEFFLLAHEVAHAWAAYASDGSAETSLRGGKATKDEELACDYLAITWLLTDALTRRDDAAPPPPADQVYGGAEFTLRVWACLEHAGAPFEDTHPVTAERFTVLRHAAGEICSSLGVSFEDVRRLAVRYDQTLEVIERAV